MRIAFISTSVVPSRTANSIEVMKVCQAFRLQGHEVKLWVPGPDPCMEWGRLQSQYGLRSEFPISWVGFARPLRRYDFIIRAVRSARGWKPDYVYVWPYQAAALASLIGFPTIFELHDRPPGRSGPFLFRTFLKGKGARRLLPITRALLEWLNREYDLELQTPFAIVAPSGVDLEQYADLPAPQLARKEWGLPEKFTAGYTGHLYPGRGLDLMLKLASTSPGIHFLWGGGEDASVELWRRKVFECGISNLQLMGFVPNERLPSLQAACDVLLMPYEGQVSVSSGGDTAQFASPMKLFEYLACGRAILASDLPVLQEVLNGNNARFAPVSEPRAWQQVLEELQANPTLRRQLGDQARLDSRRYSWETRARRSLMGLEALHAA